jgi:hypothetical protein
MEGFLAQNRIFQSQFQTGRIPLLMKLTLSDQLKQFLRLLQGAARGIVPGAAGRVRSVDGEA